MDLGVVVVGLAEVVLVAGMALLLLVLLVGGVALSLASVEAEHRRVEAWEEEDEDPEEAA